MAKRDVMPRTVTFHLDLHGLSLLSSQYRVDPSLHFLLTPRQEGIAPHSCFSTKTYIVGIQKSRLNETGFEHTNNKVYLMEKKLNTIYAQNI